MIKVQDFAPFIGKVFAVLSNYNESLIDQLYNKDSNFYFVFSKPISLTSTTGIKKFLESTPGLKFYVSKYDVQPILAAKQWYQIIVFGTFEYRNQTDSPIMASFHSSIHCYHDGSKLSIVYHSINVF